MNKKKYLHIFDFAIQIEKASISFYTDLLSLNNEAPQKNIIKGLIEAEKIHIDILENLKKNFTRTSINIKVSDIDPPSSLSELGGVGKMSFTQIIDTAIGLEEQSCDLYLRMAENSLDPEAKQIFNRLALEEEKHKLLLQELRQGKIPG